MLVTLTVCWIVFPVNWTTEASFKMVRHIYFRTFYRISVKNKQISLELHDSIDRSIYQVLSWKWRSNIGRLVVLLNVPQMSVDILWTSWDQCRSRVQYSFKYVNRNQKARLDGQPRTATSTHTEQSRPSSFLLLGRKMHLTPKVINASIWQSVNLL